MRFPLLRCLAKAVVKHGIKFLCHLAPGGGAVYDFAADVWEDYCRDAREDALRLELEALAQAPADQIDQQVEADVQAVAADQPPEVRQALNAYLTQVPAAIRRSLRRLSDPSGTTVPATVALSRPEDLMAFLPSRPPRFQPGDRPLPGVDWELEKLVGVGGFGEVWKARHTHLPNRPPVALKFCLDSAAVPALRNEAGVLDRVMQHGRHAGIVPLLHTYLSADPPCLEYEFVEGGDLAGLIQDLHGQVRMTPDMANRLFRHLVEIVAHTHRADPPIVHGDLKPANVLVCRGSDGKISLRVTDFGIGGLAAAQAARESKQRTRSRQELLTEAVRGAYTPLYASPEQMTRRRGELADPRDDVHALGVIWYQLLTGDLGMMSVPTDWREQIEERGLDGELVKLLASCIASRAEKRPGSAVVVAQKLDRLPRPSVPERLTRVEAAPMEKPRSVPQKTKRLRTEAIGRPKITAQKPQKGQRWLWRCGLTCSCILAGVGLMFALMKHWPSTENLEDVMTQPRKPDVTNSIGMRFAWCPPGTFQMGSPPDEDLRSDDEVQHKVILTKSFYLGVHEVTQSQWQTVMGNNPSKFKGDNLPVESVSWNDCQDFCQKMGQLDGKHYRLPSEAEWEYACRAGTTTPFSFGEMIGTNQANYNHEQTTPVGSYPANAWGLFDMHGNVSEWCQDSYGPYISSYLKDPQRRNSGENRVLRGGSWNNRPGRCRSAYRYERTPGYRLDYVGFRVVLCQD